MQISARGYFASLDSWILTSMIIYNLKNDDNDDKDELVCYTTDAEVIEETPCLQGVSTIKKLFSGRKGNIYYNDVLYSITQNLSEEDLNYIVNALNKAYQIGFSKGASMMLNK